MPTFDEDLDSIFSSGDFDEPVEFTISATNTLKTRGIFTDATGPVTMFGSVQVEALQPSVACKTTDIADVRNKMVARIRGIDYIVERPEKIGNGVSVVYLKTPTN